MSQTFEKEQIVIKKILLLLFLALPFFLFSLGVEFFYFVLGYIVGFSIMLLDEKYFYKLYQEKVVANDSQIVGKRSQAALITRNGMFLLVLPILSLFVLSSTGSLPGIALILAMNLVLMIEFWQLKSEPLLFQERFMANLSRPLNRKNLNYFCYLVTAYFCLLLFIWL